MLKQILVFFALCAVMVSCDNIKPQKQVIGHEASKKNHKPTIVKHQSDTVTIAAVGDIMLGTSYPDSTKLPADSAKNSFKHALSYLRNADLAFGNLEGVLLDTGAPVAYKLRFKHPAYLFRMPVKYASVIKDAGIDVLSLGNNHSNDFDKAGRTSTAKALDSLGIKYAGFKSHPYKLFTLNGVKYGFCAFSPNAQTVSLLDITAAKKIVNYLKANSDLVIVSFHGGGEGVGFEHVLPTTEIFNGENRGNLQQFAHAVVDAGADLVLGHGPHVCRAMELYKGRLIAYSIGNFATYKCVSTSGICGFAPLLKVSLNKKGAFLSGRIISFKQDHQRGLQPDSLNSAALRIKALTQTDIIQPGLNISATGTITLATAN